MGNGSSNNASIAVLRNDAPLILLSMPIEDKCVADARAELKKLGVIVTSDVFVDKKGFAIPLEKESEWKLETLLARSDDKSLKLKSTEREPQKSFLSRLTETPPKGEAAEAPKLPDVSHEKELKLPDEDLKARDLKIPVAGIAIGSDAVADAVLLDKDAWKNILQRNNMCHGIRLDDETPSASFKIAFSIIGDIPRFVVDDSAKVSATVTHSERMHAMVENKFTKVEASASYTFVAASFERTHRHDKSETTASAKTYAIGTWMLPRVVVQLRPEDLRADPELTRAVTEALALDCSDERKYFALRRIFREFGQVWATEITLGGALTVSDEIALDSTSNEDVVEDGVRAAVGVKIGAFKAGTDAGIQNNKDEKSKAFSQFQNKAFEATGGDGRRAQDPASWVSTVGPASNWRVIKRRGLLPLYMVLDASLQKEVRRILDEIDAQLTPETLSGEAPRTFPWRQAVKAERDGFLVARLVGAPANGSEDWLAASGPGGPPGKPPAAASVWGAGAEKIPLQTLTLPVRRRDTMIVEPLERGPSEGAPASAPVVHWYETVYLDEALFDPWQDVEFALGERASDGSREQQITFPTDGFLVLYASCAPGSLGQVEVMFPDAHHALLSLDHAKAGVTNASTCLPLLAGQIYKVTARGAVDLSGRFVPINPRVGKFGTPIRLESSVCYLAESDGFYIGTIFAPTDAYVEATLTSGPNREDFQKGEPVAGISLLCNSRGALVSIGCIAAPIRKNHYYFLRTSTTKGAIRFSGAFYPLRRY